MLLYTFYTHFKKVYVAFHVVNNFHCPLKAQTLEPG